MVGNLGCTGGQSDVCGTLLTQGTHGCSALASGFAIPAWSPRVAAPRRRTRARAGARGHREIRGQQAAGRYETSKDTDAVRLVRHQARRGHARGTDPDSEGGTLRRGAAMALPIARPLRAARARRTAQKGAAPRRPCDARVYSPDTAFSASATVMIKVSGSTGDTANPYR